MPPLNQHGPSYFERSHSPQTPYNHSSTLTQNPPILPSNSYETPTKVHSLFRRALSTSSGCATLLAAAELNVLAAITEWRAEIRHRQSLRDTAEMNNLTQSGLTSVIKSQAEMQQKLAHISSSLEQQGKVLD